MPGRGTEDQHARDQEHGDADEITTGGCDVSFDTENVGSGAW
jgi:hypothetical protein